MATFYGSGVGGDNPDRMVIKTVTTVNSQNIVGNSSNITIKVYGYYNYSQYTPPNPTEGENYIEVEGVKRYTGTLNTDFTGTSSSKPLFLMQWTGDIAHTSTGTKVVNIKVYQNTPNVKTMNYLYGNHNWTLPTIPRHSKITSFPNFTIGDGVTVKATRESTGFTNTFDIYVGSTFIVTSGRVSSDTYTFTASQLNGIYARIPSTTSTTVTLKAGTRSGDTLIGSVQSANATATVGADIKPTLSGVTAVETITKISNLALGANNFAQTLSSPKLTITGASANNGAKIAGYEIKFGGRTASTSTVTYSNLNLVGTNKVYARVKDSRGRWSSQVSLDTTWHAYTYPKITKLSGFRTATSSSTPLDIMGKYHRTSCAGQVASLNGKNKLTYKVQYKRSIDSSFTTIETVSPTGVSFSFTKNYGNGTSYFEPVYSYDIKLIVTDTLGNSSTNSLVVSSGRVPFSFGKDGVGAGKVWERGALDISGDIYQNGDKLIDSGSNSNGYWVRFSDGTQICYNTTQFTMPPIIPIGGVYGTGTTNYQTITFPKPFISKPTVTVRTEIGEELNCSTRTVTTTECTWRLFLYAPATEGSIKNVSFNAIGRWK